MAILTGKRARLRAAFLPGHEYALRIGEPIADWSASLTNQRAMRGRRSVTAVMAKAADRNVSAGERGQRNPSQLARNVQCFVRRKR
jgi:hypothetical protein